MRNTTPLLGLTNIGPTIADRLAAVGIATVGDLRRLGPAAAYQRVKSAHAQVTIPVCYYLYSLQGALEGRHWDDLSAATKQRLLREAGVSERKLRRRS